MSKLSASVRIPENENNRRPRDHLSTERRDEGYGITLYIYRRSSFDNFSFRSSTREFNERKKVRVYLYGLVNWKRGGGREGGSVWEKSYMVYWILFPGFGLDRRFDRCEEREGRLYFHPYYRYVMLRSRAFTNCVTVPFLRILVSPWPPFAKSSLPDRTFDLERTISQHMDYFGREKESECVHARCTQRMGISSRNARYTLFFLKQTSENIFDLRNIWTISSFKFE